MCYMFNIFLLLILFFFVKHTHARTFSFVPWSLHTKTSVLFLPGSSVSPLCLFYYSFLFFSILLSTNLSLRAFFVLSAVVFIVFSIS